MKKALLALVVACFMFTSCATLVCGPVSTCQKTKPAAGQPQRQIRVVPLILDIATGIVWVAVDFGTGAIYKPCGTPAAKK